MHDSSLLMTETCETSQKGSFFKLSFGSSASNGLEKYPYFVVIKTWSYAGFLCWLFLLVLTTVQFSKFVTVSGFDQSIELEPRMRIRALHFDADWQQITIVRIKTSKLSHEKGTLTLINTGDVPKLSDFRTSTVIFSIGFRIVKFSLKVLDHGWSSSLGLNLTPHRICLKIEHHGYIYCSQRKSTKSTFFTSEFKLLILFTEHCQWPFLKQRLEESFPRRHNGNPLVLKTPSNQKKE